MKELNKNFYAFGNMNVLLRDEELLKLAREAGCISWFVGFESISQETINNLGKTSNKVDNYKLCVNKIHDHDMSVIGAFIFGFDTDTRDVFEKTKDMIYDLGIDVVEVTNLTPYPGTPLYEKLDKQGRILTKDWSKYLERGEVVFQPKNMSPTELRDKTLDVYFEFQSMSSIIKRLPKNKKIIKRLLSHFI